MDIGTVFRLSSSTEPLKTITLEGSGPDLLRVSVNTLQSNRSVLIAAVLADGITHQLGLGLVNWNNQKLVIFYEPLIFIFSLFITFKINWVHPVQNKNVTTKWRDWRLSIVPTNSISSVNDIVLILNREYRFKVKKISHNGSGHWGGRTII